MVAYFLDSIPIDITINVLKTWKKKFKIGDNNINELFNKTMRESKCLSIQLKILQKKRKEQ